jgi:hypothetical protein
MIFDLFLAIDFNSSGYDHIAKLKFKDEPMYREISGNEVSLRFPNGYVSCLHRRNYNDSFAEKDGYKLWLFGYAFANKKYAVSQNKNPWKLNADEILNLFLNENDSFVNCLKGSYVLVLINEAKNEVTVIPDRLNVLPLYYAFEKGKLIISSNTAMILKNSWVSREVDPLAMAMQNLFDYMLGEHYFVKGIRRFENARIYSFDSQGLRKKIYWDVSELFHEKLLPKNQSLDMLAEQLKKNVNLYSSDAERILVSLTGGFDGRTNVAMLDRPLQDFKCYSYGMPGSKQIHVPQEIAKKTGIQYDPIILDKEFLNQYYENTLKASYFSNGTAPVGFGNIPYTYKKISKYSDTIITGLFGSEILRPLHNNGIQVNDQSFSIFLNNDYKKGIEHALVDTKVVRFFDNDYLTNIKNELMEYFRAQYFDKYKSYDRMIIFFFFIIQEGLRKYFSQEVSIERVYVTTRFPYFDIDLIDLIYQTPWAGMYNGFLGESKFKRRKGQLLYAHIIKKYKPELGALILDRGYTPNDLLLPFPLNYLKIGAGVWKAKEYLQKASGNDTFKTEIWALPSLNLIADNKSEFAKTVFKDQLKSILDSQEYKDNFLTFRYMASIQAFFNMINL